MPLTPAGSKPKVLLKDAIADIAIVKPETSAWIDPERLQETSSHWQELAPGQQ